MHYPTGEVVRLGDRVTLGESEPAPGIVVADMDGSEYSTGNEGWSYLKQGVMIEFKTYGLIHYVEPEEGLVLVARACGCDDTTSR